MPRRSVFDSGRNTEDLRARVQALAPVHGLLRDLGKLLIPSEIAASARDRLLYYFRRYPRIVLPREELEIVAGISEWARRIRELRVEFGWPIVSGEAAKEMQAAGDIGPEPDVTGMNDDDYVLLEDRQDREAAHRWHEAKVIRSQPTSVQAKTLAYLRANVGIPVTGEELRYVAKDKTEWARRVRELRTQEGWPVATKNTGRPDLPIGMYVLEADRQSPAHDRSIPDPVRREALRRDDYRCRRCGWRHELWNPSDPRHLELHHVIHHGAGGANEAANLVTLCTSCHDLWHRRDVEQRGSTFEEFLQSRDV